MTTHPSGGSVLACQQVVAAIAAMADPESFTGRGQWRPFAMPMPAGWNPAGATMGWASGTAGIAFAALLRTDPVNQLGGHTTHQIDGAEALRWVVRQGGDTDTNAAVAGALIGACHGTAAFRALPGAVSAQRARELAFTLADIVQQRISE